MSSTRMVKRQRVSPLAATIALSALLGASGQAPPSSVLMTGPSSVEAAAPQAPSTRTAPTQTQTVQQTAEKIGKGGGRQGQRWNINRQARRVLESVGFPPSGRQWKRFRKGTRQSPQLDQLWNVALMVANERITKAQRAA